MIHGLVRVARFTQVIVNVVLIRLHPAADLNRLRDERRKGHTLHMG